MDLPLVFAIIDFSSGIIGLFASIVIIIILLNVLHVGDNMLSRIALFCLIAIYFSLSLFRDILFFILYSSGRKYSPFGQSFLVFLLLENLVLTAILMVWIYEELSSKKFSIVIFSLAFNSFANIVFALYLVYRIKSRSSLGILLITLYSAIIVIAPNSSIYLVAVITKFIGTLLLSLEAIK